MPRSRPPGARWRLRAGRRSSGEKREEAVPRPSAEQLAERYGDTIYTFAYRLTGDADEAADLTQDVLVRVLRNLDKYQPGTFDGWLYRITRNLFLDRVRRAKKFRMEPLPEEEWRTPVSEEPGPADVLERATLDADIEHALAALRPEFRLAVVLCDVQGLSYEEISESMDWPLGTVRSRIHRGRAQLRDALAMTSGRTGVRRGGGA